MVDAPFSLDSVFELDAGSEEGDEFWAIDFPPPVLGSVEELVGHHQTTATASGTLGEYRDFLRGSNNSCTAPRVRYRIRVPG